ncbi:MAG: beta-N-acetylglucosaminidase domain-containing protein [Myxococcota bacterium]
MQDTDAGDATPSPEVDASADPDATTDVGPAPPPLPACPDGEALDADVPVIPRPRAVLAWGEPAPLESASVSVSGATEGDEATLERLRERTGLTATEDDAGLRVVLHDTARWPELVSACGLEDVDVAEAYLLDVRSEEGAWRADVVAPDALGRLHGLRTLARLAGDGVSRRATVLDHPARPGRPRGAIEGFYGEPWDPEARLEMIGEIADLKMNAFVYAPKGDPRINLFWAEPYTDEELEYVRAVAGEAHRHGVRVCWELRPEWPADFSSEEDRAAMVAKFRSIAEQGVTCLVLAFDDLNKVLMDKDDSESYTAGQAAFSNAVAEAVLADFPDLMLGFVPTEYWTDHEDTQTDLAWLGEHLHPAWEVAWTGPRIISPSITAQDVGTIEDVLGRALLLGDNYPVSDAAGPGRVHLGPLVGRDAEVMRSVDGALFNAMSQPFASLPALATAADQAWNPGAYEPEDSLTRAVDLYAAPEAEAGLSTLVRANRSATLEPSAAPALRSDLDAYWEARETDDADALAAAADALRSEHFEPFRAVPDALAHGVHEGLAGDLAPWAARTADYGRVGADALDLLDAAASGGADEEAVEALAAEIAALAEEGARPTGDAMDAFLARTLDVLEAP